MEKQKLRTNKSSDDFFIKRKNEENIVTYGESSKTPEFDIHEKIKKPFDKKKWRIKKYSNKYKIEKWEDERKKKVLHRYYKELKNEKQGFDVQKIYAQDDNEMDKSINDDKIVSQDDNDSERINNPRKLKVHERFLKLKQEKNKKKEEAMQRKAKSEEALKLYKQKKAERYKKLNKKTRKGQPIMKDRLEMLLEKIQSSCRNDNS